VHAELASWYISHNLQCVQSPCAEENALTTWELGNKCDH